MERLQTGQDRSSTSKVIRLNTVPAGQRYAMVMPSYFSRLSMLNAKKPSPHHHDMQGKTILAFRRIVHIKSYFDTIPHRRLIKAVKKRVADRKIRDLLWKFLRAGVMHRGQFAETLTGTPQGGIVTLPTKLPTCW